MTEATLNIMKETLEQSIQSSTIESLQNLRQDYYADQENRQFVKELVHEYEGKEESKLILALCSYLQLEHEATINLLENLPQNEMTILMKAESYWNINQSEKTTETISEYLKKSPNPELELILGVFLIEIDFEEAFKLITKTYASFMDELDEIAQKEELEEVTDEIQERLIEKTEEKYKPTMGGNLLYLIGRFTEKEGHYFAAKNYYEAASTLDSENPYPLFRLGYNEGLRGEESDAIKYYEGCVEIQPAHINTLINIGVLYEDAWRFDEALHCFNAVLKRFPSHKRTKLYVADCISSKSMCFDEDVERRNDRSLQILKTPVTDFELSVRSRNCLEKMNIITLGDLVKKSEAELLSYKNFGETSLTEIKEMLTKLGLKLGQTEPLILESPKKKSLKKLQNVEDDTMLNKTIADIDFSVRARKAMSRLKINTLRDLVSRSEQDLMTIKNFGQTSLTNVKQKLAQLGLKLADSKI